MSQPDSQPSQQSPQQPEPPQPTQQSQQSHRPTSQSPALMELPLSQIDAFTDEVFGGNPAAVVHLPQWLPDATLQAIAAENNLSETAFLVGEIPAEAPASPSDSPAHHLRWFTPTVEIDLCGHATLASAAQLFMTHDECAGHGHGDADIESTEHDHHESLDRLVFWTRSGWLTVTRTSTSDGSRGLLTLDFPTDPPSLYDDPATPPQGSGMPDAATVGTALGIDPGQIIDMGVGSSALMCVVDSPALVEGLDPDFAAVARLHDHAIIVTADATGSSADATADATGAATTDGAGINSGYDVVSRFFAPGFGINEDPVTGSAHTVLGPYWMGRLGRDHLVCRQASARGGVLVLDTAGNADNASDTADATGDTDATGDRILISGHAVRYLTGTITVPMPY